MQDREKNKAQLIQELEALRQRVATLEAREAAQEQALQHSEGRLRSFVEQSGDGIVLADEQGRVVVWNRSQERITGLERARVLGRPLWDVQYEMVPPEEKDAPGTYERLQDNVRQLYETGQAPWLNQVLEHEIALAGGTRRTLQVIPFAIETESGVMAASVSRDVTDQRRAQEALEQSEKEKALLLDSMAEMFAYYDTDLRVRWANRAAGESVGETAEALVGRHCYEIWHQRAAPCDECPLVGALETGVVQEDEVVTPDGRVWALRGYPVFGDDEQIVGLIEYGQDITERKRAEEALRLFKSIVEASNEAIAISDPQGRLVYINPAHERLFGRPLREAQTMNYREFYPPESVAVLDEEVAPAMARGESWEGELEAIDASGRRFPLWERADTIRDAGGEMLYGFGLMHDITERRQVEEALRETEERFRALFERMPSGVAVYQVVDDGADFVFKDFNSAAEQIEHVDRKDLIGKRLTEVFSGAKAFGIFEVLQRVWETGEAEFFPEAIYKDERDAGSWRDSRVYRLPCGDIVAVYNDVTERVQAEQALRESEARFRDLFEGAVDAIYVHDMDGHVLDVNRRACRMLGYTRAELLGMHVGDFDVQRGDQRPEGLEGIERDSGDTLLIESLHRRKDGQVFPVEVNIGAYRLAGQDVLLATVRDITARKQAEAALRAERDRAQKYLQIAGVMFVALDARGRVTLLNRKGSEILGCEPEQIMGESWFDSFVPAGVREQVRADFHRLMAGEIEAIEYYENPVSVLDGGERMIAWHNTLLENEKGDIVGTLSSGEDITERMRAQEALQESEANLAALIESSNDIIVSRDREGRAIVFNSGFERIVRNLFGVEARPGIRTMDYLPATQKAHWEGILEKVLAGASHREEFEWELGGETRYYDLSFNPIWAGGEVIGSAEFTRDITQRKRAEEALRRSEERLAKAQEVAHLGSWELDLATGKTEWSDEFFRICGLEPGAFEPTTELGLQSIHPEDRAAAARALEEAVEAGDKYNLEKRIVRPDGSVRWVHSVGAVVLDEAGHPSNLVGSFLDITERKLADLASQRYAADLERSNQELEHYAYVLSHDLRQPVRTVTGFLDLLDRRYGERLDSKGVELLQYAVDGARQMGEMVQGLLDLSRVTTRGRSFAPTDTGLLLQEVLDLLQTVIEERGARITYDPLPAVPADARQLRQVFQNLVENGIKFQGEGATPQVHVTAQRQDREWVFAVQDNGIGLDPGEADRIFNVFQRLHTAEEYPGMGIGLALCKKIVQRHGGRIWVESEPGAGATFKFTLLVEHPAEQKEAK